MNYIGIDIGTTTICGVLYDTESKTVLQAVTRPNNSVLPYPEAWKKRQDPDIILRTVYAILEDLLIEGCTVAAIGITGQMHGIVYMDDHGNAVSDLYTWQDGSGNEKMSSGLTYAEQLSSLTGYPMATGFGLVTHFYLLQNGIVPDNACKLCTIHDYAAMKLTGRSLPLLHASDAASFGGYSLETHQFDKTSLAAAGIDDAVLPDVTEECETVGTFRGIPVTVAIGDNQASFLGAVQDMENSLLVNIGTGSQVSVMTTSPTVTENTEVRPFLKGSYLLVGSSLCGGRAYAALETFFRRYACALGLSNESQYDLMNRLSEEFYRMTPSEKLEVSTRFHGTRKNPKLRGSIRNLCIDNLTPTYMIVGFLEGTVAELCELYREMETVLPKKPSHLIGSGNGLRKSKVWQDIASTEFAMPMIMTTCPEEASCGAAIFAEMALH